MGASSGCIGANWVCTCKISLHLPHHHLLWTLYSFPLNPLFFCMLFCAAILNNYSKNPHLWISSSPFRDSSASFPVSCHLSSVSAISSCSWSSGSSLVFLCSSHFFIFCIVLSLKPSSSLPASPSPFCIFLLSVPVYLSSPSLAWELVWLQCDLLSGTAAADWHGWELA